MHILETVIHCFAPWEKDDLCDVSEFANLLCPADDLCFRFYEGPDLDSHWNEPLAWNSLATNAKIRRIALCRHDLFEKVDSLDTAIEMARARNRLYHTIRVTPMLDWMIITDRPQDLSALFPDGVWPNVWIGANVSCNSEEWKVVEILKLKDRFPVVFMNVPKFKEKLSIDISKLDWVRMGNRDWPSTANEVEGLRVQSMIRLARRAGVPCCNDMEFSTAPEWRRMNFSVREESFYPDWSWQTRQLPYQRRFSTSRTAA